MNNRWIGATALFLTIAVVAIFRFGNFTSNSENENDSLAIDSTGINQEKQIFLYGINVTGLNIVEGTVSKNQTLGSILTPFNVPYQIIDEIAKKSKEVDAH